jgi:plasmanylethanolamine desaturase
VIESAKKEAGIGPSEFPMKAIDVVSVLAAIGLVLVHLVRFAQVPEMWGWLTAGVALAALPAADFISGLVHWAGDTWGNVKTPVLGSRFIRPFRFHHSHPLDMLKSNFFTTNGDTALTSLPFVLIPFFIPLDTESARLAAVFLWALGGWGMWTSQFHKWAHMKSPPRLVAWLQRRRLILSPEHHRRHHKSPFELNYCITTGWCDPVLTSIRFFPFLERVLSAATGARPRDEPADGAS